MLLCMRSKILIYVNKELISMDEINQNLSLIPLSLASDALFPQKTRNSQDPVLYVHTLRRKALENKLEVFSDNI